MVTYHYGGIIRGTAAERTGGTWTNLPIGTLFIETDTANIFDWDSSAWRQKGGSGTVESPYTWFIYKTGSNYKAKNGILGTVPSLGGTNPNTSLDTLWTNVGSNFNIAGEETNRGGHLIFGKGIFDFTTGEMLVDNTMQGGGKVGITIEGSGNSLLRFYPASGPQTAGLHIKSVGSIMVTDLDIQYNNNVTNCVYIDGSQDNLPVENGFYQNLRVYKQSQSEGGTPRQAGSRGIWVSQTHTGAPMHFNRFDNIEIKEAETGIEIDSVGNATFQSYTNIYSWQNKRGINADDALVLQSHFGPIIHQDTKSPGSPSTEYVIAVKGHYNTIGQIIADSVEDAVPTSCLVLLQPNASYNKISSLTNSGSGATLIDYSGNITNEYDNIAGFGNPNVRNRDRTGRWYGNTVLGGADGILDSIFQPHGTTIGASSFESTFGKRVCWINTTDNTQGGMYGTIGVVSRRLQPIFYCRFSVNSGSNARYLVCLTADTAAPPALITDTYKASTACIGLIVPSGTNQNYKSIRNGTNTTPIVQDLLNAGGSPVTVDTDTREVWIRGDDLNSRWLICFDNGTVHSFSTAAEIPAQDTVLTPLVVAQRISGANKNVCVYDMRLRCRN